MYTSYPSSFFLGFGLEPHSAELGTARNTGIKSNTLLVLAKLERQSSNAELNVLTTYVHIAH